MLFEIVIDKRFLVSLTQMTQPQLSLSPGWTFLPDHGQTGCLYYVGDVDSSKPTNAFDLDWTIIRPASGRKTPRGPRDWILLHPGTPDILQKLAVTSNIVIFSNQSGCVNDGKGRISDICGKLDSIINSIGVNCSVFIACGYCTYRKPKSKMWTLWQQLTNIPNNHPNDRYIGDAAGRPGDYADSDLTFALNCNIRFETPEQFFLDMTGARTNYPLPTHPSAPTHPPPLASTMFVPAAGQELIIMCGPPGAGKSTWIRRNCLLDSYTRVSQDVLKTKAKCHRAVKEALARGESVVVDNTLPDRERRGEYVALAQAAGVKVRCVLMTIPKEYAMHLNAMREDHPNEAVRKPRVPPVGETMFWSRFEKPDAGVEGLSEVFEVQWSYDPRETPLELIERWHR
jgi:bifunctional polynucleotide phosphatase/kinase